MSVVSTLTFCLGVATGLIGITFPHLTGPYVVGRLNYDVTDPTRNGRFITTLHVKREIVMTVYYPTVPSPATACAASTSAQCSSAH